MTKDRAEIRKERIESWFSDLVEEFEYTITAEELKKERNRRIQRRELAFKSPKIYSSSSEKSERLFNEQPVVLLTQIHSDHPDQATIFTDSLFEKINNLIQEEELQVEIKKFGETVNDDTVKKVSKQHNASVVFWGFQEEEKYHLVMDIQKNLSIALEHSSSIALNPPRRVVFQPLSDSISSIPYLAKFLIGTSFYAEGDPQKAGVCFEEALELLPDGNTVSIGPDESLLFRVIWSYS